MNNDDYSAEAMTMLFVDRLREIEEMARGHREYMIENGWTAESADYVAGSLLEQVTTNWLQDSFSND